MATFNLAKGQTFQLEKGIEMVHSGLVWDPLASGPAIDLDVHCFALIHPGGDANRPRLYNDGSHALCYAFVKGPSNPEGSLVKNVDGSFQTADGAMWHERDDRTGRGRSQAAAKEEHHEEEEEEEKDDHHGEGFREEFKVVLARIPEEVAELAVWATIHDAERKRQDFGKVKGSYIEVCDAMDIELCRYQLGAEFAGKTTVQVASFLKGPDGTWKFHAVGAGSNAGLGEVIQAYLG